VLSSRGESEKTQADVRKKSSLNGSGYGLLRETYGRGTQSEISKKIRKEGARTNSIKINTRLNLNKRGYLKF